MEYGDEALIDFGDGEVRASIMHIDSDEIEVTTDGGDTSVTAWLDDLAGLALAD